ncbi:MULTISPECIES: hypothetical protein [Mycobacteroides]|uniref:hypothetical protein n=1 Tax=Mycobacteroides TaxID=670516 RepID=UPI0008A9C615|nr:MULTISPECIES: hypothetical protein [Mycobacteroides]AYM40383.1 hypothetical protein DYE20_01415 [[Mycobacterium] chelonae subsp. gwanakae]OHU15969.1 hypothetical protein BKG75_13070 [Mycobacteroides chelonae]SIF23999.1 Uncharacterised protein [Mycobacteroides abscessus subsp. abscessus]SIF37859.1 Uncharacterised protein [Mycobacteroides abscessus subsp. abscessus]SIF84986.1 Uncharacterised protein [Mycobacteroides abscessus subsp. abscessus]
MTVPQSDPIDPTDNAARDDLNHETVRRTVWRLLLDLADSPADAVVRAAETVTVDELTLLAPASGKLYGLMVTVAQTGQRPDAVTLLSGALAAGLFSGPGGNQLHHVLLTLAGATGEALRLPTSLRGVLALVVRSRAAALGHALASNAASAGEADLTAFASRDATELIAQIARLEAYDRSCGVHVEPAAELIARKAAA